MQRDTFNGKHGLVNRIRMSKAEFVEQCRKYGGKRGGYYSSSWAGGSYEDNFKHSRDGDASLVPQAEALLHKVLADVNTDEYVRTPCLDVAGYFPCVPAFLSGMPENMFTFTPQVTDRSPVRVFCSVVHSAGVSVETIRRRGVAVMALVLALTRLRPVELVTYHTLDYVRFDERGRLFIEVRHNSTPLQISEACWHLTAAGYSRSLAFPGFGNELAGSSSYGGIRWLPGAFDRDYVQELLGCKPHDVYVPGTYLNGDEHKEIDSDPVAWINKHVKRVMEITPE